MVCSSKLSVTTVIILFLSIVIFSLSFLHQKCIIIHHLTSYKSMLLRVNVRRKPTYIFYTEMCFILLYLPSRAKYLHIDLLGA